MKPLHKGLAGLVCGSLVLVSLPDGLAASTTTSRSQPEAQAAWITAAKTSQNARKPERDLFHFPVSKVYPEDAQIRVRTSERGIWEWLELGFMVTLGSSALASVLLAVLAS